MSGPYEEEVRSQLLHVAPLLFRLAVAIGTFETVQDIEVADEAAADEVFAWFEHSERYDACDGG